MDFKTRLKTLRQQFATFKVDAILVSSSININYLTGFSNFSLTEREAYLLITPKNQYLFTDPRYTEEVTRAAPHFQIIEISSKLPMRQALKDIANQQNTKIIGVEESNVTWSESKRLKKIFPKLAPVNIDHLRWIKDESEVAKIKAACLLGDQLFDFILTKIKPGITEKELVWEMEKFTKEAGAEFSFDPVVAFGANAAMAHYRAGDTKLTNKPTIILLDFGVKLDDYCSDMTRTIFWGKAPADLKKIYETVIQSHDAAVDHIKQNLKSKLTAAGPDHPARQVLIDNGYPDLPHALGHGIGLEVHEDPVLSTRSQDELKPGMVFSIEPGIYLTGVGGVRIEDLYYLTKTELIQLTKATKKLIEL